MDDSAFRLICREALWAKQKRSTVATILAVIAAGLSLAVDWYTGILSFPWFPLLCIGFIAAMWLDAGLMRYRQKKGFYGNNDMEASELVRYMIARRKQVQ